jgi:hypothetical protein
MTVTAITRTTHHHYHSNNNSMQCELCEIAAPAVFEREVLYHRAVDQ